MKIKTVFTDLGNFTYMEKNSDFGLVGEIEIVRDEYDLDDCKLFKQVDNLYDGKEYHNELIPSPSKVVEIGFLGVYIATDAGFFVIPMQRVKGVLFRFEELK